MSRTIEIRPVNSNHTKLGDLSYGDLFYYSETAPNRYGKLYMKSRVSNYAPDYETYYDCPEIGGDGHGFSTCLSHKETVTKFIGKVVIEQA